MRFRQYLIVAVLTFVCSRTLNAIPVTDSKSISILPIINRAGLVHDYKRELIETYLFVYINKVEGYSAEMVTADQFIKSGIQSDAALDHDDYNTIGKITGSRYILNGIYSGDIDNPDKLIFSFVVWDLVGQRKIITYNDTASGDLDVDSALERIALSLIENMTGVMLMFGSLIIETDKPCSVYIDDTGPFETPFRENRMITGDHLIRIEHEGITIYKQSHKVLERKQTRLDLSVFVLVSITAEYECIVFIDGDEVGPTPFSAEFISGSLLDIELQYKSQYSTQYSTIKKEQVLLQGQKEVTMHADADCSIEFVNTNPAVSLTASMYKKAPPQSVPLSFSDLYSGKYHLQSFIDDSEWKTVHRIYNHKKSVAGGESVLLDLGIYKPAWGLSLLPGGSQFYHTKYLKAGLFLGFFLTGITVLAGAPIGAYLIYKYDYVDKRYPGYPESMIRSTMQSVQALLIGGITGGAITALIAWIASLIDGIVTTRHLLHLFNTGQPQKKRIKTSFELRLSS